MAGTGLNAAAAGCGHRARARAAIDNGKMGNGLMQGPARKRCRRLPIWPSCGIIECILSLAAAIAPRPIPRAAIPPSRRLGRAEAASSCCTVLRLCAALARASCSQCLVDAETEKRPLVLGRWSFAMLRLSLIPEEMGGAVRGTLLASGQGRPLDSSDDQTLPRLSLQHLA